MLVVRDEWERDRASSILCKIHLQVTTTFGRSKLYFQKCAPAKSDFGRKMHLFQPNFACDIIISMATVKWSPLIGSQTKLLSLAGVCYIIKCRSRLRCALVSALTIQPRKVRADWIAQCVVASEGNTALWAYWCVDPNCSVFWSVP